MKNKDLSKVFAGTVAINSVADVESTLNNIITRMSEIFWIMTVIVLIWAAYTFLTAGDNEEKIEKAKKIILYAVIAAAVAILTGTANNIQTLVGNILKGQ